MLPADSSVNSRLAPKSAPSPALRHHVSPRHSSSLSEASIWSRFPAAPLYHCTKISSFARSWAHWKQWLESRSLQRLQIVLLLIILTSRRSFPAQKLFFYFFSPAKVYRHSKSAVSSPALKDSKTAVAMASWLRLCFVVSSIIASAFTSFQSLEDAVLERYANAGKKRSCSRGFNVPSSLKSSVLSTTRKNAQELSSIKVFPGFSCHSFINATVSMSGVSPVWSFKNVLGSREIFFHSVLYQISRVAPYHLAFTVLIPTLQRVGVYLAEGRLRFCIVPSRNFFPGGSFPARLFSVRFFKQSL